MTIVYDLDKIHANNGGNCVPLPHLPINGYSRGFALMLSDGVHDGICFAGYESKNQAIEAACENSIPDGWHLYLLSENGRDPRNCSHIRWALYAEFVE